MYVPAPASRPKQLGLSMLLMGVEQSEKGALASPEETNPENQESDQDSEQTSTDPDSQSESEEEPPRSPPSSSEEPRPTVTRKLRPVVGLVPRKRVAEGALVRSQARPLEPIPSLPFKAPVRPYNQSLRMYPKEPSSPLPPLISPTSTTAMISTSGNVSTNTSSTNNLPGNGAPITAPVNNTSMNNTSTAMTSMPAGSTPMASASHNNALVNSSLVNSALVNSTLPNNSGLESASSGPRKRRSRPYQCDRCDYATTQSSHLVTHKRTHTGEKPFQCDICNFACSASCNLITHKRIHTGDKPFRCDRCNYACRRSFDLSRHKRTHTGEKPLRCDMCDYACCRTSDLVSHRRLHTVLLNGEKPYKCDICGYSCSQAGTLSNHRKTHERTYNCEVCAFSCNKRPLFTAHAKVHDGPPEYIHYLPQVMERPEYLELSHLEDTSRMYRSCLPSPPYMPPVYSHPHFMSPFPAELGVGPSVGIGSVGISNPNDYLMQPSLNMDHTSLISLPRS